MRNLVLNVMGIALLGIAMVNTGCIPQSSIGGAASGQANREADRSMYQEVAYANAGKRGPTLIVLPGQIKNSDATFTQKVTANNIADFAEIELSNANFRVLERSDLGPMLNEVKLAVNMGSPDALKKFKKGKFKTTKWFVKFDVLKAQKTTSAGQGFSGAALGSIFGQIVGGTTGAVGSTAIGSTRTNEQASVWIIGLRYKIIDAATSEQVDTGYVEKKMETGMKKRALLGMSGGAAQLVTLDTVVQRTVQEAVRKIDQKK